MLKLYWADKSYWHYQIATLLISIGWNCGVPFIAVYLHHDLHLSLLWIALFFTLTNGLPAGFGFLIGNLLDKSLSNERLIRRVSIMLLVLSGLILTEFRQPSSFWTLCTLWLSITSLRAVLRVFSQVYIVRHYPKRAHFEAFSVNYIFFNLGAACGAFLGGYFLGQHFLIGMACFIALGAFVLLTFKPRAPFKQQTPHPLVTPISASKASTKPVIPPTHTQLNPPLSMPGQQSHRWISSYMIAFLLAEFLAFMIWNQTVVSFPLVLTLRHVEDWRRIFSLYFVINCVGVVLLQLPISRLISRTATQWNILIGCAFILSSFVLFDLATHPLVYDLAALVFTLGEIIIEPTSQILLSQLTPDSHKGRGFGLSQIVALGRGVSPIVGISLLSISIPTYFNVISGLIILSYLGYAYSASRRGMMP